MINLDQITRPTLLLNERIAKNNLATLAGKFQSKGIGFNPHFKTHQSHEVGCWFREYGVDAITVSSVKMAEFFIKDGWKDVSIAFPFNIRELPVINSIPPEVQITLDVVTPETAEILSAQLKRPVRVMIEMDAGYGRTGVSVKDYHTIDRILATINRSESLSFYGFYIHPGHTYDARNINEIERIYGETLISLSQLKQRYISEWTSLKISVGDTPGCSLLDFFDGVDEVRPGNFIFYDMVMYHLGVCDLDQIAVAMAVPVVDKQPSRNEIVFHGGGIHFSKDSVKDAEGRTHFGWPCLLNEKGWSLPDGQSFVRKLSQEHGIATCSETFFNQVSVGDVIAVLPVHSCLTADCMKEYISISGNNIKMMQI